MTAALLAGTSLAWAQDHFPSEGVEIIVPFGPGGGADATARVLAPLLQAELGVPVFVSNVPGHSGNAGLTRLMLNPADGYTMAVLSSKTVAGWAAGLGYARPSDFAVVGVVQDAVSMLFVPTTSTAGTWADFMAELESRPGRTRIATAGAGTTDELALRMLSSTGYDAVGVPFANPLDQYASLDRARTQAIYEQPGDVAPFLRSNRWKPLVVFDNKRHPAFPDVPCISESGIQAGDLHNERMLVVSSKTPPERKALLARALASALAMPQWTQHCQATFSCSTPSSPQASTARVDELFKKLSSQIAALPNDPVAMVSRR